MRILLAFILLFPAGLCSFSPDDPRAAELTSVSLPPTAPPYVSDEIVVILRNSPPRNEVLKISGSVIPWTAYRRVEISAPLRQALGGELMVVKIPGDTDLDDAIAAFRTDANVVYASKNPLFSADLIPDDPDYSEQWSLRDGPSDKDIEVESAWDITRGSPAVLVGVIDTGIDTTHVDLRDNLVAGFDFCSASASDSIRNADGYWFRPVGDFADRDPCPFDEFGHGTHVAGTIGAKGNNSLGIAGVAWNVKLMPLRAMFTLEMSLASRYHLAQGRMTDIIAALDRARTSGCRVVNMSFSGTVNDTLFHTAIITAFQAGMVLVASAGNTGGNSMRYPAGYPEVLAVSAGNRSQQKASFSSYGSWIDVAAPGEDIYSTFPMNDDFYLKDQVVTQCTRDYGALSGTSMSTAHVSGVAALLLSENPGLSSGQVMDIIRKSADPVGGYDYSRNGCCPEMGYGKVNAFNALFRAMGRGRVATDTSIRYDLEVTGDITVPSGCTLEIGNDVTLRIADGKRIQVSGVLRVAGGALFTRSAGGSFWSGIDIKPGGVLEAAGDMTIEYADCGIDLLAADGISNGAHTLTIRNCRQAGIWIADCSPSLRNIICDQVSDRFFQNGGITVSGPSAGPRLSRVTVSRSWNGIMVGDHASVSVDSSDIRDEEGDCILVQEGAHIHLNGANNICPAPGRRAINHPPNGRIEAVNNYWGDDPDFSTLFTFPALIDCTGYTTAMFEGDPRTAGSGKPVGEPDTRGESPGESVAVYPNPANPSTTIRFALNRASRVALAIYSITGQKVATLVDASLGAGIHAVRFDGSRYASGMYFYRFRSDTLIRSGKFLVVK